MKRTLLIISAASLLLVGCAKEQLVEKSSYTGPVTVVSATFESLVEDGATKAAVSEEGAFTWQNGDKAAFAESSSSSSYCSGTNSADDATAQFAIEGIHTFTASSWAIYPYDLTTSQAPTTLKVNVPASRVWAQNQTNVAMYGKYETASKSFSFSHMGGLVRVRVKNVPTNAREFVFKANGCKINGEFTPVSEDSYNVIKTTTSSTEGEQTYTLTWTTAPAAENTMDFYIPLPVGEYSGGFAFYLKDEGNNVLYSKVGSTSQTIARKKLLLMPAITLVGGSIEPVEKAALVANIPAGYSGDFLLPQSEKVLLKINASTEDHDITLKYDGANIPTNLEVKVVDGDNAGNYNAKLLGNLPSTHVEFTLGHIDATELTTSSSTFAVINPATVGTLTVKGGNVKIEGATVQAIEVDSDAVADSETGLPVQIAVEKYTPEGGTAQTPAITDGIKAKASIVVAPDAEVTVKVQVEGDVQVAKAGEGSVTGVTTTDAQAKIGENNYFTLADAVKAAPKNATEATTITLLGDVTDGAGIFLGAADKKNIIIDLNSKTYTAKNVPVGSPTYETQAFHFEEGNTVTIKNGTLNVASDADAQMKMLIQNYCNLTLEDVTVDGTNLKTSNSQYVFSNNCGNIEMKGTTSITAPEGFVAFDVCKYGSYTAPKVTWNSTGSVAGIIELSGGEFVVTKDLALTKPIKAVAQATFAVNANITPASGWSGGDGLVIVRRGGDLTVNGTGKISYNNNTNIYEAVKVTESGEAASGTVAKLTLNGPTLEGYYYGITGNGGRQNTDITINSGTVKGFATNDNAGIYHPQSGNLTINGGTIEGATGIYVKSGTVVTAVNGGTVKGTGAKAAYQTKDDGFVSTGDALLFDNCDYPGGEPHATINGGTFISTNANAVASYAKDGKTPITDFIHGGTYSDESAIKYAAQNANINIALQANRDASGIFLGQNKNVKVTFDLGGKTLNFKAPAVGSSGTENQAFHIEQGNQLFTLKNGKVTIDEGAKTAFRFIIQNYNNLTVENVELDGSNLGFEGKTRYTVSNNQGTVNFTGSTSIKAASENDVAFDVCKYSNYSAPIVTWASTGSVDGIIELSGGTFELGADLCVNAPVYVTSTNKSTLNLNEKKLYNTTEIWNKDSAKKWVELIRVEGGKLEINDTQNGSVAAKVNDCYAVNVREGGELTINGGTYKGNVSAVQVVIGTATIQGGSFEQQDAEYNTFVLNCIDANFKAETAKIIVKGGSFKGFNPGNNLAEGESTNFVAEGYTSTENNGVWTVSANQN